MKSSALIAAILAAVALALAMFAYLEFIAMLGFPDGFISELGRAQRRLAYMFIVGNILFSLYFMYAAWRGLKHRSIVTLWPVGLAYMLMLTTLLLLNGYYQQTLRSGGGG